MTVILKNTTICREAPPQRGRHFLEWVLMMTCLSFVAYLGKNLPISCNHSRAPSAQCRQDWLISSKGCSSLNNIPHNHVLPLLPKDLQGVAETAPLTLEYVGPIQLMVNLLGLPLGHPQVLYLDMYLNLFLSSADFLMHARNPPWSPLSQIGSRGWGLPTTSSVRGPPVNIHLSASLTSSQRVKRRRWRDVGALNPNSMTQRNRTKSTVNGRSLLSVHEMNSYSADWEHGWESRCQTLSVTMDLSPSSRISNKWAASFEESFSPAKHGPRTLLLSLSSSTWLTMSTGLPLTDIDFDWNEKMQLASQLPRIAAWNARGLFAVDPQARKRKLQEIERLCRIGDIIIVLKSHGSIADIEQTFPSFLALCNLHAESSRGGIVFLVRESLVDCCRLTYNKIVAGRLSRLRLQFGDELSCGLSLFAIHVEGEDHDYSSQCALLNVFKDWLLANDLCIAMIGMLNHHTHSDRHSIAHCIRRLSKQQRVSAPLCPPYPLILAPALLLHDPLTM